MSHILKSTVLLLTIILSLSSQARLPPKEEGTVYYAALHERAYYNDYLLYSKDYGNKDWFADSTLNKITNARYDAIDRRMVTGITQALIKFADDENLKIASKNINTSGVLTTEFKPSSTKNVLDFTISGVNVHAYAKVKKSWYATGTLNLDVTNITIKGQYNYFNGNVTVQDVNAPISADIDININIPLISIILDPILDHFIDKEIDDLLPTDLKDLFNGGNGYSSTIAGIADFIPLNELVFQGVDYGQVFRDKLEKSSVINDNFSISIGNIIVHEQLLSVTVGNVTYKRYTSGGKRFCKIGTRGCDDPLIK